MARTSHPLLLIPADAIHRELTAQTQDLTAENDILRSKPPDRSTVTGGGAAPALEWEADHLPL